MKVKNIFIILLLAGLSLSITACTDASAFNESSKVKASSKTASVEVVASEDTAEISSSEISSVETSTNVSSIETSSKSTSSKAVSSKVTSSTVDNSSKKENNKVELPKYPILRRTSMLEGTSVSFVREFTKVTAPYEIFDDYWSQLFLIKSLEQLTVMKEAIPGFSADYTGTFFSDNALIIIPVTLSSYVYKIETISLIKSNRELCIGITLSGNEGPVPGAVGYSLFVFEVKQSEISEIVDFRVYSQPLLPFKDS